MIHSEFYKEQLQQLLNTVVISNVLHSKWLNTLSFLENCGARKIAACEHPILVKQDMLKHAAEEFRHAHHLKRQIEKINSNKIETYSQPFMLGGYLTLHYLNALDIKASRFLKQAGLTFNSIKEAAYLTVTYAIECRASQLYPLYDQVLRQHSSSVSVKSILLEEQEHLNEMKDLLGHFPSGLIYANEICKIESQLFAKWIMVLSNEIHPFLN